jgi:SOS-response transcriptional repressor LexA
MTGVTEKQARVLEYIVERAIDGGTPSIREMAYHFGIASNRAMTVHLDALQRKGLLSRGSMSREIAVPSSGLDIVAQRRPELAGRIIAHELALRWDAMKPSERSARIEALVEAHRAASPEEQSDTGDELPSPGTEDL